MGLYFLNDEPMETGIGRFSNSISKVIGSSRTLSLVKDKSIRSRNFPGTKYFGFFPPVTSGWLLNSTLQNVVFRGALRKIGKEAVAHYGSVFLKPFRKNDNDVITFLDFYFEKYSRSSLLAKQASRNLNAFLKFHNAVAISGHTAKIAMERGFEGHVAVVYPEVSDYITQMTTDKSSLIQLRKKFGIPEDKIVVLSVSSGAGNKNIRFMESLVRHLHETHRNTVFVKVGFPVQGAINLPPLSDSLLNEVYNLSDVYVQPSLEEGFCLPVVEAMKSGTPVVTNDIDIFREVTEDAAVFSELNLEKFSSAVFDAIDRREELIKSGIRVSARYSHDNFSRSIRAFYKSIGITEFTE